MIDFKLFYLTIRRYKKGRITRTEFCTDWEYAQKTIKQAVST